MTPDFDNLGGALMKSGKIEKAIFKLKMAFHL
jgi:hypothetical protein